MKKAFVVGLIIIPALTVVLLGMVTSRSCSCLEDTSDVTVTIRKMSLSEVSFTLSTVDVAVRLENDNAVGATLDKIEYDIYFGYEGRWIWLGRGEKAGLNIEANDIADFAVTTRIENKQLLKTLVGTIFGTDPTEMKVDGHAWFTVGSDTIEVDFDEKDIDPYNPLIVNEQTEGTQTDGTVE